MHIANSLSSVIYPPASLNGPPPFIFMHFSIKISFCTFLANSLKEPHESPAKAPKMQPKDLSRKESVSCLRLIRIYSFTFSIDSTDSDSYSVFFSSLASFSAAGHLDLVSAFEYEFLMSLYHSNVCGVKDYKFSNP